MRDVAISLIAYSLMLGYVMLRGDPIFIGLWYYLLLLGGIWVVAFVTHVKEYFRTGATLALCASLLIYIVANATKTRPDGLLGLGHLFSIPGAYIGLLLAAVLAKRIDSISSLRWLTLGLIGFGVGFGINQAIVCKTLIYCGALF
jgi:hypothetical protein